MKIIFGFYCWDRDLYSIHHYTLQQKTKQIKNKYSKHKTKVKIQILGKKFSNRRNSRITLTNLQKTWQILKSLCQSVIGHVGIPKMSSCQRIRPTESLYVIKNRRQEMWSKLRKKWFNE